ncbi:MAG: glycerophosphodiester phosphodiesterase family protein [Candidatus Izemoplasmatales bacterium]
MKLFKKLFIVIAILLVLSLILLFAPKPKYPKTNPFLSKDGMPLVMAHAGGKGTYPDNTMAAYLYSFNLGVDVLEMDVQLTKDGIPVLVHGQNITGNTVQHSNCDMVVWEEDYQDLYNQCNFGYTYQEDNGDYLYKDMTPSEWQDAKVYLPTLEELFQTFGSDTLYNIEIKADADAPRNETADAVITLIEDYDLKDHVLLATAFDDISQYIVEEYPDIMLSMSYGSAIDTVVNIYTLTTLFRGKPIFAAMQVPLSYDLPLIGNFNVNRWGIMHSLKQQDIALHFWTINDEDTMRKLIEQGVDGIITDYPELLISIIEEYKTNE